MSMEETVHKSEDITSEIKEMVAKPEFTGQKGEFSGVTDTMTKKKGTTGERAWDMVTEKIVMFLPDYITEGLIRCSLEEIAKQDACRDAAGKQRMLKITPGKNFPAIRIKTFYPYLDFILKAGPFYLLHQKIRFKVEGSMALKDATIEFTDSTIEKISGTIKVSMTISLCKGTYPVPLHTIDKIILVT
jgi:hypothetical protein